MFSCNLPPALLAEWPGSFTCYCDNSAWNGYQNKSQPRKLTPEIKMITPLLQGLEFATFQSRVWCSNHWAIPTSTNRCVACCATVCLHWLREGWQWVHLLLNGSRQWRRNCSAGDSIITLSEQGQKLLSTIFREITLRPWKKMERFFLITDFEV